MAKKDGAIEIEGQVVEPLPNAMFRVELRERAQGSRSHQRQDAQCTTSASCPVDRVVVELSPYDLTRGRITHHYK